MKKSTENPTSSETTGLQSLGQAASSSIGRLRGGTGSVVPLTTVEPDLPAAVEEAVATGDPRAVDKALIASLPRTLSSLVSIATNADYEPIGLTIANVDIVPLDDLRTGLALVVRCLRPTLASYIAQQMAACDMVTKARPEHAMDTKARIAVFVEDLREFPADVVAEAFKFWRRTETWSPTVVDIRERCWRKAAIRVSAKLRLESAINRRTA